jgi:hypothetical protein
VHCRDSESYGAVAECSPSSAEQDVQHIGRGKVRQPMLALSAQAMPNPNETPAQNFAGSPVPLTIANIDCLFHRRHQRAAALHDPNAFVVIIG